MNPLDAIAILLIVLAVLLGVRSGALPQLLGLVGAAVAALGGLAVLPAVTPFLDQLSAPIRAVVVLSVLLGLAWVVLAAGWSWSQQQFYVAEHEGRVAIFRGIDADLPGISLSHPYETTDVDLDRLSDIDADAVREGIEAGDLDEARVTVDLYAGRQDVSSE